MPESQPLPTFEYAQGYPRKFVVPARMTVLPLGERRLALVSPIPIDDALAARLRELGEVVLLIAPNLLHHLYLAAAAARYPDAEVLAPPALADKCPGLRIDIPLDGPLPEVLVHAVEIVRIEGAPRIDEFVLFHRATRTLVITDLVFNMVRPRGLFPNLVLALVGARGKLASSRAVRFLVRDRAAAAASVQRVLALDTETLIVAHGDIVRKDARARLSHALAWLSPRTQALPAATQ